MSHPRFNNSRAVKAANELYPTPAPFTRVLLRHWRLPHTVWEPAAGNGDMSRVLEEAGHRVISTDLLGGQDFFETAAPPDVTAIVTNPPFSLATEWALRSVSLVPTVALLMPLYALGGEKRADTLWSQHPPTLIIVVSDRMRLDGQTSHFNHMWVVWDRTHGDSTTIFEWATAGAAK